MDDFLLFRRRMAGLTVLVIAVLLVGCSGESGDSPKRPAGVPNVVMICIDTVRWDTWWTPERAGFDDRFGPWAERSQVMAQAVSAAPWTIPSVATVVTGLYPSQHGGGLFDSEVANLDQQVPSAIGRSAPTLAELLLKAGFTTGAVSAHPWFRADYGFERGFEQMHARKGAARLTDKGLEWLDAEARQGERFFLYLHYMDAHDPHLDLENSRELVERLAPERREALISTAPGPACDEPDSDMCIRYLSYTVATLELREQMARLLESLEDRHLLDDTLVVLYSDHGEAFHDHHEIAADRAVDPRGFYGVGHGQSLYQEQLHVPLQFWHPTYSGREVAIPVSLVDVLPAVFEWLGLDLPDDLDFPGRSFAPDVAGAEARAFDWSDDQRVWKNIGERELFASGIAYGPEQLAVIDGGHKLIWHQFDNEREYYDLNADPLEGDPAPSLPDDLADSMEALLDRYFGWFGSQDYLPPELTDDNVEELKGVGYLQGVESRREEDRGENKDGGGQ